MGFPPEQCFLSVEADEAPARTYIEEFGDDNLVCSTDYPHAHFEGTEALPRALADRLAEKVLAENAMATYTRLRPHRAAREASP